MGPEWPLLIPANPLGLQPDDLMAESRTPA